MNEHDDEHILIGKIIQGDASAFDKIYEHYNLKVYSFALRNLKNRQDAEGVVQEVFLSLWNEREKLKNIKNLNAWLFSVCFNIIRKHFRKLSYEQKYLNHLTDSKILEDTDTVTEIEYNNLLTEADKIINHLPPRQKQIFYLSRKNGVSNDQISQKLNISKKTVENQLSIAVTFLRKSLADGSVLSFLFFWLFIK